MAPGRSILPYQSVNRLPVVDESSSPLPPPLPRHMQSAPGEATKRERRHDVHELNDAPALRSLVFVGASATAIQPSGTSDIESSCRFRPEKLDSGEWQLPADPDVRALQYSPSELEPREWLSLRWWLRLVRERAHFFCPAWYSVTMGTGMVGNLMLLTPWPKAHSVLRWPGLVIVLFDTTLYVIQRHYRYTDCHAALGQICRLSPPLAGAIHKHTLPHVEDMDTSYTITLPRHTCHEYVALNPYESR